MAGWGSDLAKTWTNNVQPSRPSNEEIVIYTRYLREVQMRIGKRKANLLVLGSTPEFRDWGYEQALNITVVDKSNEYYKVITREIRHKNLREDVVESLWEDMRFQKKFDIVIGDLSIGNVESRFDDFLISIREALSDEGFFMGKSFLWDSKRQVMNPREIIKYYKTRSYLHPYNVINHLLGLYCLDKNSMKIDFSKMYEEMVKLKNDGIIDSDLMHYFENIGWNTDMKFTFFSPSQEYFIKKVNEYLKFVRFEHTSEEFTYEFPIYVIRRN